MKKVSYSKLEGDRVWFDEVEIKKITDKNGKDIGKYSAIKSKYNFGTSDSEYLRSLRMEFPVGTSNRGIQVQENENGTTNHTIRYVPDNLTEGEELLEKMIMLKKCAAKALHENRSKVHNIKASSKLESITDNIRDIMYVKTDEMGVRMEGSSPSKFLKLDTGSYLIDFRTRFERVAGVDKNGEPVMEEVPWELLEGMCVTFKPIVEFYRIFSGTAGQSFQSKLRSAIVINIDKPKHRNDHEETAKTLLEDKTYLKEQAGKWEMAREMADARARGELVEEESDSSGGVVIDPLAAVKAVSNIPSIPSSSESMKEEPKSLTEFVKTEDSDKPMMVSLPSIPGLPNM